MSDREGWADRVRRVSGSYHSGLEVADMRLAIITGGRDLDHTDPALRKAVRAALLSYGITHVMHGACGIHKGAVQGGDRIGHDVARELGLHVFMMPAAWNKHGKSAGMIRNGAMVDVGKEIAGTIGIVLPGGPGTNDCHNRMKAAGLEIVRIEG